VSRKPGTGGKCLQEEARKADQKTAGQLNPPWVEWLMGFPIGWTDLKPLAMVKFQQWLQQFGGFLRKDEQ